MSRDGISVESCGGMQMGFGAPTRLRSIPKAEGAAGSISGLRENLAEYRLELLGQHL
jgi:hypothetical protein